ncbi:MAG TPA: hypothetical protein DCP28_30940 [Cytophagales bacterium]|nr:hypothetical protein [Cytophagales bacterium]
MPEGTIASTIQTIRRIATQGRKAHVLVWPTNDLDSIWSSVAAELEVPEKLGVVVVHVSSSSLPKEAPFQHLKASGKNWKQDFIDVLSPIMSDVAAKPHRWIWPWVSVSVVLFGIILFLILSKPWEEPSTISNSVTESTDTASSETEISFEPESLPTPSDDDGPGTISNEKAKINIHTPKQLAYLTLTTSDSFDGVPFSIDGEMQSLGSVGTQWDNIPVPAGRPFIVIVGFEEGADTLYMPSLNAGETPTRTTNP